MSIPLLHDSLQGKSYNNCPVHRTFYPIDGMCPQCLAAAAPQRELVNMLQAQIADLKQELADLRDENRDLRGRVLELGKTVERLDASRARHFGYICKLEIAIAELDTKLEQRVATLLERQNTTTRVRTGN